MEHLVRCHLSRQGINGIDERSSKLRPPVKHTERLHIGTDGEQQRIRPGHVEGASAFAHDKEEKHGD